jgi:histidinol-phosphatase
VELHDEDLAIAHGLADVAAEVAMGYFGRPTGSEIKDDGTPVGEADLAVDRVLLERLRDLRPDDEVLSEESGVVGSASPRRWIVDPIDGTVPFLAGEPHWGTHIALQDHGEIVVGVVTRPAFGLRWWASRGGGAYRARAHTGKLEDVQRLQTSAVATLREARVTVWDKTTSLELDALRSAGKLVEPAFNNVLTVLDGEAEVMVVPGAIWDHAPFLVLLDEAGGSYHDPEGGRRLDLGAGIYTNGHVDEELEALIRGWQR